MSTTINTNELELNGVKYVRADGVAAPTPTGNRCVVVADRGWIFAGDVTEENGRLYLDRAVHVRSWSTVGFDGMLDPKNAASVTLKTLAHRVDMPADAELFRVPVGASWGL